MCPHDRSWQSRRVAWTKEVLDILRVEDSILADTIPLEEIQTVCAMSEMSKAENSLTQQGSQIGFARDSADLGNLVINDGLSRAVQV